MCGVRDVALQVADWDRPVVSPLIVTDEADDSILRQRIRMSRTFSFSHKSTGHTAGRFVCRQSLHRIGARPRVSVHIADARCGPSTDPRLAVDLKRWINAPQLGWYPGDPHIHAAGCAHYEIPTQGVTPEAMIRHVRGEGLAVGDVLTWGPGYYYQKQFFSGHVYEPHNQLAHPAYQVANNVTLIPQATAHDAESLIRYDVEVSGFPSSISGHLVLLRLRDQDFPGALRIEKAVVGSAHPEMGPGTEGAVVGYAHGGLGFSWRRGTCRTMTSRGSTPAP